MIFISFWIFTFLMSTILFYKASGTLSLSKPNIHTLIFIYSFLISSFIGALLIVLGIDNSYMIVKIANQDVKELGFYLICGTMILVPLSMILFSKIYAFNPHSEFKRYYNIKIESFKTDKGDKTFFIIFLISSLLCTLSVVYIFVTTKTIPILHIFSGAEQTSGELRQLGKTSFSGNVFIKNFIAMGLTTLLSVIALIYTSITSQKRWRILFLILFVLSIMMNLYDLQKAPVLFYFLLILITAVYIGNIKLNLKLYSLITIVGISYILLVYSLNGYTENQTYLTYSNGPVGRIVLSQIAPTFLYLDRYGSVYPFLGVEGLPSSLLQIYEINQVRPGKVLMQDFFPEKVEQGTAGVLNTLFVGEAYASFGIFGVIFAGILLGFFVQWVYIHFIRLPKHPLFLAIFIYLMIQIPRAFVGGFMDILFNPLWIFLYLFCLSCYFGIKFYYEDDFI